MTQRVCGAPAPPSARHAGEMVGEPRGHGATTAGSRVHQAVAAVMVAGVLSLLTTPGAGAAPAVASNVPAIHRHHSAHYSLLVYDLARLVTVMACK